MTYDVAKAKTDAKRLELARKLFSESKLAEGNPVEEYVLLKTVTILASIGHVCPVTTSRTIRCGCNCSR